GLACENLARCKVPRRMRKILDNTLTLRWHAGMITPQSTMPTKQSAIKSTPRGVLTVMFTDIVDSSRLKSVMSGDSSAARDANYHARIKGPHDQLVAKRVEEFD